MPQAKQKTAWLAGSTGLVGRHLLRSLLDSADFTTVVALVRRPLDWSHPKLHAAVVDFDKLDEGTSLPTPTAVFCSLGTTIKKAGSKEAFRKVDYEYPLRLAKLARQAGAPEFSIVTSVDADPKSRNFYLRTKGELEEAIGKLGFPALRIYRPSFLAGDREETRAGESIGIAIASALSFALVGPLKKYRVIDASDVALAMVIASGKGRTNGTRVYEHHEIREVLK